MNSRRAGALLLSVLLAACGGDDSATGGDWAGTVEDSAGVSVVSNPASGAWGSDEAWTVSRDLDIGELEGAPEYQFGQIAGIDVDDEGRIYVLDQQAQRIGVYGSDGEFSHYIGEPGAGPGQLTGPAAVMVNGGEVVVPDLATQRVSIFSTDGEFQRSWRIQMEGGIPMIWKRDAAGRPVAQLRSFNPAQQSGTDPVVAYGDSGQVQDTLVELTRGTTFEMTETGPRFRFFVPEPVWEMTGTGSIVSAMNNQFRIEFRDTAGELERIVKLDRQPVPISDGDERRILSMIGEMMESQGTPPQAVQQMLGNASVADHYPVFAAFFAGPDNTLWVQRIQPLAATGDGEAPAGEGADDLQNLGSAEWDVFDDEGRYLGMVTMPEDFQPLRFAEDAIYGVWRDDMDVQHVVRLRLQQGGTATQA